MLSGLSQRLSRIRHLLPDFSRNGRRPALSGGRKLPAGLPQLLCRLLSQIVRLGRVAPLQLPGRPLRQLLCPLCQPSGILRPLSLLRQIEGLLFQPLGGLSELLRQSAGLLCQLLLAGLLSRPPLSGRLIHLLQSLGVLRLLLCQLPSLFLQWRCCRIPLLPAQLPGRLLTSLCSLLGGLPGPVELPGVGLFGGLICLTGKLQRPLGGRRLRAELFSRL